MPYADEYTDNWQDMLFNPHLGTHTPFAPIYEKPPRRLKLAQIRGGIEAVNRDLLTRTTDVKRVLAAFGAKIAGHGVFHGPLIIHNAKPDYRLLWIGSNVHLGRGVTLDLSGNLQIQGDATVSMGCTLLTHTSVGDRPLKNVIRHEIKTTAIGRGAYVGANVTVLPGCHIGDRAIVGAGSVVTRPVPPDTRVAGVPARPL